MEAYIDNVNALIPWFFPAVAFILGAMIGSFLNVCIYRIPENKSIVHPGSHCYSCGKPIPFHLNVPILAWVFLRGRAACCGAPFSIRYPAIELLTALLFFAAWMVAPPTVALVFFLWISFMICVTFIDLDHMIIPDRFSIGGMFIGVFLSVFIPQLHNVAAPDALAGGFSSMIISIKGALIGSGIILWIMILAELALQKEAMGFGDVKLMGAIGAFCGWQGAVFSLFGGAVLGTIAFVIFKGITAISTRKPTKPQDEEKDASKEEDEESGSQEIPFGPMLAAGSILYLLWLKPYVMAYFDSLSFLIAQ